MRWGWLCSSGGSGWTSTGQPTRPTSSAQGWAIAPQAMSASTPCRDPWSDREREEVDEPVVEVGAVGELDIAHLLEQRSGAGALLHAQQAHLGALAGDVARGDDAEHRQPGDQPDADRRGGGEVAPERPGQQHLLDLARLEAELLEEQRPSGGDRGLGELQL